MKRLAILVFIIIVIPVWIVSCDECDHGKSVVGRWTWDTPNISVIEGFDYSPEANNDTIKTDSVYFRVSLPQKSLTGSTNSFNSIYSAVACAEPPQPIQTDPIKKIVCGIGDTSNLDTSISSQLTIKIYDQIFDWQKNKGEIIQRLSSGHGIFISKFPNPHNSKPTQIVIMAIKESGDTLNAVSVKKVFK